MNTNGISSTRHEISIAGGAMVLMDEDGNTYDAQSLASYRDAKRQVQRWASAYTINVAVAYRELADYFSRR